MNKRSILLVDDEENLLITLGDILQEEGYDTTTALSGKKAVTELNKRRYDLVITDLVMEGIDGIGVLNKVKEVDSNIPVIILTGRSDKLSGDETEQVGANDYIVKPCDLVELLDRIAQCLEKGIDSKK